MNATPDTERRFSNGSLTPMMRQYAHHKERHPDAILLFRMGDFYEMFYEDAEAASHILGIALTTRDKNKDEQVPMCGFPHHSASKYISTLLEAGRRVAVCDQMEDPRQAKGVVKREVTRVLTPGLTDEAETLKADQNHYVTALAMRGKDIGIASFDLSTGDLLVTETSDAGLAGQELTRLGPKEALLPDGLGEDHLLRRLADDSFYVGVADEWMSDVRGCNDTLRDLYGVQSVEGFGLAEKSAMTLAAGMLVSYVRQTRPEAPSHVKAPRVYHLGDFMVLDRSTLRNLEIFTNIKDGGTAGTLWSVLDRTLTSMGARLLRHWISYPLLDVKELARRHETVDTLVKAATIRDDLRVALGDIGDLERIAGRISLGSAGPRDLVQLRGSAEKIPGLVGLLSTIETPLAAEIAAMDDLSYVAHAVATVLVDAPPAGLKDGGVIRERYDRELDELRSMSTQGKAWIAGIEAKEREKTGIPNLKVGYNKVFGYFIEVTKAHQEKIPEGYIRKQTLVNAERYITEELKEYELKVLNAQERSVELEAEIFRRLRERLLEVIPRIQETSRRIATLDALAALAEVAATNRYVRPRVHGGDEIRIKDGRHPVVEQFEARETYVPNDVFLNRSTDQILIITGPNMAGKSTYMRQIALLVILAQIGSFAPAAEASIGTVDRIFTRIGAADYLAFGQSTFMVEMNETADILHNSTERSLVLLDEVGRGTSTFDGLSIARAVTEYLHDREDGGPRTLFATHYHELVELAAEKKRVRVYNVSVKEWGDKVVFLRKIVPGGASRSYGIQVAKLAGIPDSVIARASDILAELESHPIEAPDDPTTGKRRKKAPVADLPLQGALFDSPAQKLLEKLRLLDPNNLTPLEALNILAEWKRDVS